MILFLLSSCFLWLDSSQEIVCFSTDDNSSSTYDFILTLYGEEDEDLAGYSIDAVGDIDGATDAGKVYFIWGSSLQNAELISENGAFDMAQAPYVVRGNTANELFGSFVLFVGDLDDDENPDILIGTNKGEESDSEENERLYFLSASSFAGTSEVDLTQQATSFPGTKAVVGPVDTFSSNDLVVLRNSDTRLYTQYSNIDALLNGTDDFYQPGDDYSYEWWNSTIENVSLGYLNGDETQDVILSDPYGVPMDGDAGTSVGNVYISVSCDSSR